eukprot:3503816-Pyramimonas_sp.AAC.1
MGALKLRLANTYGKRAPTWKHCTRNYEHVYDYFAIPTDWQVPEVCCSWVLPSDVVHARAREMTFSDHKLLQLRLPDHQAKLRP